MIDDSEIKIEHINGLRPISLMGFLRMALDGVIPCNDMEALHSLIAWIRRGRIVFKEEPREWLRKAFGASFTLLSHITMHPRDHMARSNHCAIQPELCEVWIARSGEVKHFAYAPRIARIPFPPDLLDTMLVYSKLNNNAHEL